MTHTMHKTYSNYPCAHRQWRDSGHCAYVHGYSRSFTFTFEAAALDECGWVLGFQHLQPVKAHLDYMFDHTLLLNVDDPLLEHFALLEGLGAAAIRILNNVSMEGTATHLFEFVNNWLATEPTFVERGVRCIAVEARENDKNAARYTHG